jgi:autoinducer 2 (AI-2) kinase
VKYVLTIDAGTGSGRALIFDFRGRQIAQCSREWIAPAIPKYPGSAVFETERAWKSICECIRSVLRSSRISPKQIAAVTAASMREGFVLYDKNKREIWACPNIDARAGKEAAELIRTGLDELIYERGGDGLAITAPARLHWIREHEPKIWSRAKFFSMISDWVVFRFCGEIVTDPSCGSSSGLFDLGQRTWSEELTDKLELPGIFPRVISPGTVLGNIRAAAAKETGLSTETKVVVGGGDTQLGLLGCAGEGASGLTVVGGTFWQTAVLTRKPLIDPQRRVRTLCHVLPGEWMTEGIGFLNGLAMRWVRDTICPDLVEKAARAKKDAYELMEALASRAMAGANGISALVSCVMNAKRWIQPPVSFIGIQPIREDSYGENARGALVRATQESAVFTSWAHWEIIRDLSGLRAGSLTFCGGAAKGRLWPKIMADVMDLPVRIPKVKEATSLGATFCALAGLREFHNLSEAAAALVKWERTIDPNPKQHAIYRELAPRHLALQQALLDLVDASVVSAMWRAPGV